MPSSTKIITPSSEIGAQSKRKLETTVSTENATGGAKKKEKPINEVKCDPSKHSIAEVMEIDQEPHETPKITDKVEAIPINEAVPTTSSSEKEKEENLDMQESLKKIEELCDELMEKTDKKKEKKSEVKQKEIVVDEKTTKLEESPEIVTPVTTPKAADVKKEAIKKISSPIKRDMVKNKTSDLSSAINSNTMTATTATPSETKNVDISSSAAPIVKKTTTPVERKSSLSETPEANSSVVKPTEKRRSRILETAEKFQNMNNQNNEKYKKFSIPGVSVGNFKKEFERKASLTQTEPKKLLEKRGSIVEQSNENNNYSSAQQKVNEDKNGEQMIEREGEQINQSDSKSSVQSFTLEDARRSMENSIALLQKARNESQAKEMDQLCSRMSDSIGLSSSSINSEMESERERKLRAAREIIGNAIPPSRLIGVRKKPPVYGLHGRSVSGSVVQTPSPRQSTPLKSNSMEQQYVGGQLSHVVPEKGMQFVLITLFITIKPSLE